MNIVLRITVIRIVEFSSLSLTVLFSFAGVNGGDSHGKCKSKRNYKLLIDPAIKKGHQKIYRFDGVLSGVCAI